MAVALDTQSTGVVSNNAGTTYPVAINPAITVGSGSNRVLVATVVTDGDINFPTAITCNWDSTGSNQSMTYIAGRTTAGTNTNQGLGIYFFGLVNPASGTKTLSLNSTGQSRETHLYCFAFTGANQTGGATTFPHNASNIGTTATTLTSSLVSASGNFTVGAALSDNTVSTLTQSSGYIQNVGPSVASAAHDATGAALVTYTVTTGGAGNNIIVGGIDIAAAGGVFTWLQMTPGDDAINQLQDNEKRYEMIGY